MRTLRRALPLVSVVLVLSAAAACGREESRGAASSRVRKQFDLFKIDPYVERAHDVDSFVDPYRQVVRALYGSPIGRIEDNLLKGTPESDLGNFCADVLKEKAEEIAGEKVDIAVVNNGGLRCPLFKGKLTAGDIFELMPFDNEIVVVDMKGGDLMRLFDDIAGRGGEPLSGAELEIGWGKVRSARVGGLKVDKSRVYKVATHSYLAAGNGGFPSFKLAMEIKQTGMLYRDAIIQAVTEISKRDGAVRRPPAGRIKVVVE